MTTETTTGADILRAHARLASIDPAASAGRFLPDVLEAVLAGAGRPCGIAVDPKRPDDVIASGFSPSASALAICRALAESDGEETIPASALEGIFPKEEAEDPRVIPFTAGEETLVLLVLPGPPLDPVGFASVTAHAASLMARVNMAEKVREAGFELKMRLWELESLYEVGLSIAGTLDLESLADDVLMRSVSLLNAQSGTLILRDAAGSGSVLVKDIGGQLICEDHGEICFTPEDEVLVLNDRALRPPSLVDAPAEKLMGVAIRSDGKNLGVLFVADKEARGGGVADFNESDKRVLKLFGNQAAIALENARLHRDALEKERMEREIELAGSIQATILPTTLPPAKGLELAGGNRPTRQVGGDYFNVLPLPDGRTVFCVADVSGKGVPAALLVSTVHACLHLLVGPHVDDLAGLVQRLNRHLVTFSSTRKFVTLFLCVFDPRTRELRYVNAGHNPAILLSGDSTTLLPAGGVPVGMIPKATHGEGFVPLKSGDLLCLYSDGITEALNGEDEEFELPRLTELLTSERNEPVAAIKDRIFSAVATFTTGVAQYDDQTVLVARVP